MNRPPVFNHFVVVPTKRPEAISYFLDSYWEHAQQMGPADRTHFIIVNSSQLPAYHKLKKAVNEFKITNPKVADRVHFINFEWRDRFIVGLKKRNVPSTLRDFLREFSYSQLRNIGYLASLRLAKELKLRPERVLVHQIDDDVLPEYTRYDSPRARIPLPKSISLFRTAEQLFANKKRTVHAVLGNYSGQPDMEVPDSLSKAIRGGSPHEDEYSPQTKEGIRQDVDRALEYYDALLGSVDSELPNSWLKQPKSRDFTNLVHHEEFTNQRAQGKNIGLLPVGRPGGALVFRLDWYGHVPPTSFRGEDHLHIADRIVEDSDHVYVAPTRLLFHDKSPQRDFLWDAKSDFEDGILRSTMEPVTQWIADYKELISLHPAQIRDLKTDFEEKTTKLILHIMKDSAIKRFADCPHPRIIERAQTAASELVDETQNEITELKKLPSKKRDKKAIRTQRDFLQKLQYLQELQTKLASRLERLRDFYLKAASKPDPAYVQHVVRSITSFHNRNYLFNKHKDEIISAALEVPVQQKKSSPS